MIRPFLSILRFGIGNSVSVENTEALLKLSFSQWIELMALAEYQGVAAIAFDGVQKLYETGKQKINAAIESPTEWMQMVYDNTGLMTLYEQRCQQQQKVIGEVAKIMALNGIQMMVFKGQANAVYYPVPYHRATGDIDCWLFGEAEKGDALMRGIGALVSFDWYRHSKISFKGELIENHRVLGHTKGGKKENKWMSSFRL